jgi:phage terminase large subunit-like protein
MLGYDAMGIGGIMQDLDDIPCEKVEIGQYPKSLNDACRNMQGTVAGRTCCYDKNNELLSWSMVNAQSVVNSKQELLIDKKMQRHRIDPIDAVLDAWKCMLLTDDNAAEAEKQQQTIDDWLNLMKRLDN